ncbi:MAG TPA: hypothetical protein VMF12_12370 [Xanthobacteraceae bacterium]|nr:hypothetical protein [Xanthobacteraceae bacterium]
MSIQSLSFFQQDQNYWSQNQSFYTQDQNYWSQARAQSQASNADAALINVMGSAETNEVKGLASIANATALKRVNSQISALVQQALQASSGGSTSSSSSGTTAASSRASTASSNSPSPATATGTVPVTTSTPLSSLGVLSGGSITISAGANATTYTSTGSDTVGNLISAINVDLPTNANVTASLNSHGQLVITSRNTTNSILIGGFYASNIGFGVGHNSFSPVAPSPAASAISSLTSAASSANSTSTQTSSTASSNSKSSKAALPGYLASAEQGGSTALGVLAAEGVSGNLVDLLA